MKYNDEGYLDLTPYEALKNVEVERRRYRPLVYICSPYAGDTEKHTAAAVRFCRYAFKAGCIPIAPHIYFPQFVDGVTERSDALFMGNVLLTKCMELWAFGDKISSGMEMEIAYAKRKGKPVRYFTEDFTEVFP